MSPNIGQPLFGGHCAVRALWFDLALIGEAQARRRILAHWRAGARLYRSSGGYLLEWPSARWLPVAQLDGLALCDVGHVLSSAPLSQAERAQLARGSYWLVRGARAWSAAPEESVDPSAWLDLEHVALREPLRFPGVDVVQDQDGGGATPLREILGTSVPPASAQRGRFLAQARQAAGEGGAGAAAVLAGAAAGAALGIVGLLVRWAGRAPSGDQPGTGSSSAPVLSPLARRLASWRDRLANLSGVSRVMGWRQGQFLQKTLDLFAAGDLMEALRHAIPLGALDGTSDWTALGTPQRRDSLTIGGARGGASISVHASVQQRLRETYRRAFERLDREGKIDEAVYVLAELLACGAEAVAYLEKKERFRQAAQLAETLQLAPDIAVRMWVLAGDSARAARIARLHGAYDGALRLLESRQSEHAAPLRLAWALYLAERGDLVQAIDVIWPLGGHDALVRDWFDLAERAGGALGMRLLARKLVLMPELLTDMAPAIETVLAAGGEEGMLQRERLARELLLCACTDAVQRVATLLLRRLLADSHKRNDGLQFHELEKLVKWASAPVLSADLPPLRMAGSAPAKPLAERSEALSVRFDETGLLPIRDACLLPDGGYLLALGESGVVRINRAGRQTARYPVPAEHLVLADSGQRVLVLMERDASQRIGRIDLITGKVSDWLHLRLSDWAQRYDGVIWNVVQDGRLLALDTAAAQHSVSWQVGDLPGRIAAFADRASAMTMLLATTEGIEQWTYALPGRQLRQRDVYPIRSGAGQSLLPGHAAAAPWLMELVEEDGNTVLQAGSYGKTRPARIGLDKGSAVRQAILASDMLCILVQSGLRARSIVVNVQNGAVMADVRLNHASAARIAVQGPHLLTFDRSGRLVDIDTQTGIVVTRSLA